MAHILLSTCLGRPSDSLKLSEPLRRISRQRIHSKNVRRLVSAAGHTGTVWQCQRRNCLGQHYLTASR